MERPGAGFSPWGCLSVENDVYAYSKVRATSMKFAKTLLASRKERVDFFWVLIANMWEGPRTWAGIDTDPCQLDEAFHSYGCVQEQSRTKLKMVWPSLPHLHT